MGVFLGPLLTERLGASRLSTLVFEPFSFLFAFFIIFFAFLIIFFAFFICFFAFFDLSFIIALGFFVLLLKVLGSSS